MEISLHGTQEKPILLLVFKNIGVNPIKIDSELIFLVNINIIGPKGTPLRLEEVKSVPIPSRKSIEERFVLLLPGQTLQRKFELKNSFKIFIYGIGTSDKHISVTAYEAFCRVPEHINPQRIDVFYTPFYGFREGFAQYTGIESTTLGLFEGPVQASIKYGWFDK